MRRQHPIWTTAGTVPGTVAIGAVLAFGIPAACAALGIRRTTDGAMDGPELVVMVLGFVGVLLILLGTLYLGVLLLIGPHLLGRRYLNRERPSGGRGSTLAISPTRERTVP